MGVYLTYILCLMLNWTVTMLPASILILMAGLTAAAPIVYLYAGLRALIVVVRRTQGTYFSVDCIWFNCLMAGMYVLPIAIKLVFFRDRFRF